MAGMGLSIAERAKSDRGLKENHCPTTSDSPTTYSCTPQNVAAQKGTAHARTQKVL